MQAPQGINVGQADFDDPQLAGARLPPLRHRPGFSRLRVAVQLGLQSTAGAAGGAMTFDLGNGVRGGVGGGIGEGDDFRVAIDAGGR